MLLTIVDDPTDPEQRAERLVLFDFETGDQVLGEVGTGGSGPTALTYGGGRFLLEIQEGPVSRFEFRDVAGAVPNKNTLFNNYLSLRGAFSEAVSLKVNRFASRR